MRVNRPELDFGRPKHLLISRLQVSDKLPNLGVRTPSPSGIGVFNHHIDLLATPQAEDAIERQQEE